MDDALEKDQHDIDQYEAADVLLKFVFSGALGPSKDMGVSYTLMHTTDSTFTYSAALEAFEGPPSPVDRYQIKVDRQTRELSTAVRIEITDEEMEMAILAATGETMISSSRFIDGSLSISYKVTTKQKPDSAYVVQLRHHGNVASMDALMRLVQAQSQPDSVPMPAIHSIPGERERQRITGLGRQMAQFVPGVMAEEVYSDMSHAERLVLVRRIALAWQAFWDLPMPLPRQIGELLATELDGVISLAVGPDRHYSLGGPFASAREWLKARIQHALTSLERASGIDDFKNEYLTSIKAFVQTRLNQIPQTVENVPVVAIHADMGLHNIIVASDDHTKINAIIDWEFCASAPYLAAYDCMNMLFRAGAPNGFGSEYPQADELRQTFWNSIPRWKIHWESQSTRDFMEWFEFTRFMKPEYCSSELSTEEKMIFWAENRRVVEGMLKKYGAAGS